MSNVKETELIGIGKKFLVEAESGEEVIIVIHDDGRRELYSYDAVEGESQRVMTLTDQESRQVAGIIGGMAYKPLALESVEIALDDLSIEWYKVPSDSPVLTKTIGELDIRKETGAAIIAAIAEGQTTIVPGPEFSITAGATLVIAGKRQHITHVKDILLGK